MIDYYSEFQLFQTSDGTKIKIVSGWINHKDKKQNMNQLQQLVKTIMEPNLEPAIIFLVNAIELF